MDRPTAADSKMSSWVHNVSRLLLRVAACCSVQPQATGPHLLLPKRMLVRLGQLHRPSHVLLAIAQLPRPSYSLTNSRRQQPVPMAETLIPKQCHEWQLAAACSHLMIDTTAPSPAPPPARACMSWSAPSPSSRSSRCSPAPPSSPPGSAARAPPLRSPGAA